MRTEPVRVVMLGGGYVTLHAYQVLARRRRRDIRAGRLEIVVVSADDHHSFHGFTGEVLAGDLPIEVTRTSLREAMPSATLVHATVTRVDRDACKVFFRRVSSWECAEESLRYDELVVGTGGREPASTVDGLAEHGFTLRAPGDIKRLARRLALLEHPSRRRSDSACADLVVIGGGLAGVEMAAALAARGTRHTTRRVHLVHAGEAVLPELRARQPRLGRLADRELERLRVQVIPGVRVTQVCADGVVLSDGRRLPAALVLGTIGQRAALLPGLDDLPRDPSGRLAVDRRLRAAPGLWAAGDAASVRHPMTGALVPTNALWAMKAGDQVGRNLSRRVGGGRFGQFRYLGLGQAASLGIGHGIAELCGIPLTGWLAWLMRVGFFLRFMPSRAAALQAARHLVRRMRPRMEALAPQRTGSADLAQTPAPSQTAGVAA